MFIRVAFINVVVLASTIAVQAETLRFSGLAVAGCTLGVPTDGTLQLGADLSSWSTLTPATITAINTGPATLSVARPTAWASSPSGTPSTTFAVSAATIGANSLQLNLSGQSGNLALALLGTNTLSVSLAASASSPYRTGLHTAEVTVTCSVP